MRSIALSAALTLVMTAAVFGQDVPFAAPPLPQPGQVEGMDVASLGGIMSITQLRHIKLWYAGKSHNWDLVGYESDRINENFVRAAMLYRNIPVEYVVAIGRTLGDMRSAVAAKDPEKFVSSYSAMTTACNACHVAGHVGFIRIQEPTSSPFSDEMFR